MSGCKRKHEAQSFTIRVQSALLLPITDFHSFLYQSQCFHCLPSSVQNLKDTEGSFQQRVCNHSGREIQDTFRMNVFPRCFKIIKETDKNQSAHRGAGDTLTKFGNITLPVIGEGIEEHGTVDSGHFSLSSLFCGHPVFPWLQAYVYSGLRVFSPSFTLPGMAFPPLSYLARSSSFTA